MKENKNTPQARFQFLGYLIDQCSINLSGKPVGNEMEFSINPSGDFNKQENKFMLTMFVAVNDKEHNLDLNLRIRGTFVYETEDNDILRKFIGVNAPALLFPYIRAYVSNITALSGCPPIIMPTLNMMAVGEQLVKGLNM